MTNQEMVRILKGTLEEKKNLYDDLLNKLTSGELLQDNEVAIFETLKKELTIKSEIVDMSATLKGTSNAGV